MYHSYLAYHSITYVHWQFQSLNPLNAGIWLHVCGLQPTDIKNSCEAMVPRNIMNYMTITPLLTV